jgi:hypothetical protein
MRPLFLILTLTILSCGQSETKQKELELKEKELALREKELELKEKGSKQDSTVQLTNTQNSIVSNSDEIILEIRTEFSRINSLPLTKKSFDWECEDAPMSGTMVYYFDNNKIVKVKIQEGTEHHESVTENYYKDGKFIFSYEVFTSIPLSGPETKTEYRTYVKNDKVIRSMENKIITKSERKELDNSSTEYKVLKAYSTKNFVAVLCN